MGHPEVIDQRVRDWIARDPDPETRAELEQLVALGDTEEIGNRFATRLAFGTAGLRGVLGAGPSRMNRLVVRETTAGFGAYLLDTLADVAGRGVVVGYDARRGSRGFAFDAAGVLAALGIRVYLMDREQPTPVCSFAVKELGAAAGIVVTASHNPPEYSGYKVYWQNGAQIIPPHDQGITRAIERAAEEPPPWMEPEVACTKGQIEMVGDELVRRYLDGLSRLSLHPCRPVRSEMTIAYTPLHGVAGRIAEAALARAGFERVFAAPSQREPDPRFPTVRFPNPEEPGAMDVVLALAREVGADLAFANDPDGDRLAVAVRTQAGTYRRLTGDQVGVLLGADVLDCATDRISVATTIVSSRMLGVMAADKGVEIVETLTGFKWIVNQGLERESQGFRFAFGYEEALGYTIGSLVPDKDGISAMVAFAELAAECRSRGMTVLDRLEELYRSYGLYATAQRSLALDPGASGPSVGSRLRRSPPRIVGGRKVVSFLDVETGVRQFADGRTDKTTLPPSDVLVFDLEKDARVVVRPSGTEPKLKCYYEVRETIAPRETFDNADERAQAALAWLIELHQRDLAAAAG